MRVLITRPQRQGERTAQRLIELGHEAVMMPLSEPVHDGAAAIAALAKTTGALAITSAEAVRALSDQAASLTQHLDRPLYAVGNATAEAATAAGFRTVKAASGDGGDLADLIAAEITGSVTYLAGRPRAETFEKRAAELGLELVIAECYRMEPITPGSDARETLQQSPPEAILLYSRETAIGLFRFFNPLPEWLTAARILCLSEAVAAAVPARLQKNLRIAVMPDEQSLLSLL
jgi:uroporphyrinogen-III synthase